jgi:hypothetical protein
MVVQSSYSENIRTALPGMIANTNEASVDSRSVENSNGIPFGRACGRGTADNGVVLGSTASTDFLGISVRDATLVASSTDYVDVYETNAMAGIMYEGDIWVTTGGAVNDGDNVTYNSTTGVLSSAGTSGSQFAITGARWMRTAGSGELSIVRLTGNLPSA